MIIGLFLLVMIASAVQGTPSIHLIGSPPGPRRNEPIPEVPGSGGIPAPPSLPPSPMGELIGTTLLGVLVALVGIGIVLLLARTLIRAWRDRQLRRRDGDEVGLTAAYALSVPEPEVIAEVIQRGIIGALREIDERSIPADAIVAAWVGLEESAADAGLARGVSETPGEFTLRIITRKSGISDDAEKLLRLYERVRFGGYSAGEEDRDAARAALKNIERGWR